LKLSGYRVCAIATVMVLCTFGSLSARAAPAFMVSVCLADVEYSIACWERSSLEAARRLEQIFIEDYTTRRTTGSLQIWFALNTSQSEQLRFLREVEDRAIQAAVRKMQAAVDTETSTPNSSQAPMFSQAPAQSSDEGSPGQTAADQAHLLAQLLQKRHEDIQKWREDATVEARKGSNWSHDWASRTHVYKPGPALDALVRSPNGNSSGSP
jgi:hypothetical protein